MFVPGDEAHSGAVGQEAAGDDERGRQRRAGLETPGRRDRGAHRGPAAQDQGTGAPGMSHSIVENYSNREVLTNILPFGR